MRPAVRLAVALLVVAPWFTPSAGASEAADCDVAPVPLRTPDGTDAAPGPLATAEVHLVGLAVNVTHARVNESRATWLDYTKVTAVLVVTHPDAPGFTWTVTHEHDLVGTRSVTCFTWREPDGFVVNEIHAWANGTAAGSLVLDAWAGD